MKNNVKRSKSSNSSGVTDFGIRKVSQMNFSYIVTLPKEFVRNIKTGKMVTALRRTMLKDGSLKLTPVCEKEEAAEFSVM